jgi:Spy/CpxP family protein refolding chaperone
MWSFIMKKFKQMAAAVVVSSILGGAMVAFADETKEPEPGFHHHFKSEDNLGDSHPKHGMREHGLRHGKHLPFHLLNLTESQKQTLEASRIARQPELKEIHEKLRAARQALKNAGDQNADDATLNKLAGDLATIIAQQEVARIKMHREFVNILTPEQQEKLTAFEAEHKGAARWKHREKDREENREKNKERHKEKDRQKSTSSTNSAKS